MFDKIGSPLDLYILYNDFDVEKKTVAHHVSSVKRDFQKKSTSHTKRIILGYV